MVLGIYGSGGLGREIFDLARLLNAKSTRWSSLVFVDDFANSIPGDSVLKISFEEAVCRYAPKDLELVIAVGEPAIRAALYTRVLKRGYALATVVHPNCEISPSAHVSAGAIVCSGTMVSTGAKIGENVLVQPRVCIGHDAAIGDHSVISTFVCLAGGCSIGQRSYIGMGVPVKELVQIGDESIVGMGSVVLRNIDSGMIALGNPARPMAKNENKRVFGG